MSGVLQHPDEKTLELARFRVAEARQEMIEHLNRTFPQFRQRCETGFRQLDFHQSPILWAPTPTDQTFRFEAVDHAGHRAGIIGEVLAELRRRRVLAALGEHADRHVLRGADLERRQVRVPGERFVERAHMRGLNPVHQLPDAIGGLVRLEVVNPSFRTQPLHLEGYSSCLGNHCQGCFPFESVG